MLDTNSITHNVKLIKQRKKNDCLVCCCAMYFDLTYEDTVEYIKKCSEYYEIYLKDQALPISMARRICLMQSRLDSNWIRSYRFDRSKPAILAMNGKSGLHCVYWSDVMYDPGNVDLTEIKYVFQRMF